jgi:hypothetical protein
MARHNFIAEQSDGTVHYYENSSPAQMLIDGVSPQADTWLEDVYSDGNHYMGTLLEVAQNGHFDEFEAFQCDGCKRYFGAGDTYLDGSSEYCYDNCSHLHDKD